MAFLEDLSIYFADFGEDATLDGQAVRVIFERPVQPDPVGGGIAAGAPQALIASTSVPAVFSGKPLVLASATYTVRNAYADGTGITLLELAAA